MTFAFDPKSQRFRWTSGIFAGRFMSRQDVEEVVEANINRIKGDLSTITNLLLQHKISVATWEDEVFGAFKKGAIQSYLLGKGGRYQLTARDKNNLTLLIGSESQYLRRFAQDVLDGKLSEKQIQDRTSKYGDSFHRYYSTGRAEGHRLNGFRWEARRTTPGEICSSCQYYASVGWQLIGTLPAIGTGSECRMRCRCYFEYSKSNTKPMQQSLLHRRFGWVA
jgi:hypothetical protein